MPNVDEGTFRYNFPQTWRAVKFDGLAFYRKHFQDFGGGTKAVDIVAVEPGIGQQGSILWLIEVKDYSEHDREKKLPIGLELAQKISGTLACLMAGRANAGHVVNTTINEIWEAALQETTINFVFHYEQPNKQSRLFPQPIDPKNIKDILSKTIRAVDPHPLAGDSTTINGRRLGWQIERIV